ncbi:tetratricopeptide repeat protein, partial [Microcystis aeruginosa CS-567/02-A1]
NKTYTAKIIPNPNLENLDLALIEFQSNQNYCLRQITSIIPNLETPVMAAGYSIDKQQIVYRTGTVQQIPERPLKEGYQIGYTSDIEQGMSGGTIINSRGEIIGINGKSAYPILNTGFTYSDGTKPTQTQIQKMRTVSWGIPVFTFLAQVNPQTLTAYSLPLPQHSYTIPETGFTGWLGELERKAQQITVRIDSSSNANGSGIIIAKDGDTYTVLTTAHVVCERQDATQPCGDFIYQILAPDGKQYPVEKNTIKTEAGLDLAVLKFTANQQTYEVATLADYSPQRDYNLEYANYMFTAGYPRLGNNSPWRFTAGQIANKELGLLLVTASDFSTTKLGIEQTSFLTGGYELVYSSITYGGMSGGPVLDSMGRVIGIHGRGEGEEAYDSQTGDCGSNSRCVTQIGVSLGIPVSTFLAIATRLDVQPQKVENTPATGLNEEQVNSIKQALTLTDIPNSNATAVQWLERGNQLFRLSRHAEAIEAFDQVIKLQPSFIHLAYFGKGWTFGDQEKYQEALVALEQAIYYKPDFATARRLQILAYTNLEQWDKALVAIEKSIRLQPNNPTNHLIKGIVLSNLESYTEASSVLTEAIKFHPSPLAYFFRAATYLQSQKLDLALADLNQAIQMSPQYAFAYSNRGDIYRKQEKWELAIADYTKAIEINPKLALAYNNRGWVYQQQEKWELAIADYTKAVEINPQYAVAYNNRGWVYEGQERWELAIADYTKAIEINPQDAFAYRYRGDIYRKQERWELAIADYTKAIEIDRQNPGFYNNRGFVYVQQKKWGLALTDLNRAIEINPKFANPYNHRGHVYREQEKWELALADFTKAIQINPAYADAYYNRGLIYKEQKKWELALADFTKVFQITGEYADAYYNRGLIYREQEKWELALADFTKAIQINPELAQAYANIGLVYNQMGNKPKAIENLQQAAQLFQAQGNTADYEGVLNILKDLQR